MSNINDEVESFCKWCGAAFRKALKEAGKDFEEWQSNCVKNPGKNDERVD